FEKALRKRISGGLTPSIARDARDVPAIQQTLWALSVGNGLFFLSTIGWGYVIPELILFRRQVIPQEFQRIKLILIAFILLILFLAFPPEILFLSAFSNITDKLSSDYLYISVMFGLALLTCWRFSKIDLIFWILLFNTLIMTKAVTWDKYALPTIIILWFLKSVKARRESFANESLIS
ncbi:MAG: hypothetical protein F6J97_23385, partial [Leptolyngbya sp. SIO4C1]|nr:hypothetical protein [Leptolyngbya sp. SIO4C1]